MRGFILNKVRVGIPDGLLLHDDQVAAPTYMGGMIVRGLGIFAFAELGRGDDWVCQMG